MYEKRLVIIGLSCMILSPVLPVSLQPVLNELVTTLISLTQRLMAQIEKVKRKEEKEAMREDEDEDDSSDDDDEDDDDDDDKQDQEVELAQKVDDSETMNTNDERVINDGTEEKKGDFEVDQEDDGEYDDTSPIVSRLGKFMLILYFALV